MLQPLATLPQEKKEDISLFLDCNFSAPPIVPPQGTIWALNPQPGLRGGLTSCFDTSGTARKMFKDDVLGYKCELFNYSNIPLFEITLAFNIVFREVLRRAPNQWESGR